MKILFLPVEGFTCSVVEHCSDEVFASAVMVLVANRNLRLMTLRFTGREPSSRSKITSIVV